jgi:hypothetical protein
MGRKRKAGATGNYFNDITQQAVIDYINAESEYVKNKIFREHLLFPFTKIAEVYYNTLNVPYIEGNPKDIINDCVTHLITKSVLTFNGDKGKAYSYMSVSAKNYFIVKNDRAYTKVKKDRKLSSFDEGQELIDESIYDDEYNDEMRKLFYKFKEYLIDVTNDSGNTSTALKEMKHIIDYMETFEDEDTQMSKFINSKIRDKYSMSTLKYARLKQIMFKLWSDYKEYYLTNGVYKEYKSIYTTS